MTTEDVLRSMILLVDADKLESNLNASPKLSRLYNLLIKGADEDAIREYLYPGSHDKASYYRLRKRLSSQIFELIRIKGFKRKHIDSYARKKYSFSNTVALIEMMSISGMREEAVFLAHGMVRKAERMEYVDLCVRLYRVLSHYYGLINFNEDLYIKYKRIYQSNHDLEQRTMEIHQRYVSLRSKTNKSLARGRRDIRLFAIECSDLAREYISRQHLSYELLLYAYQIILIRYELERDSNKVIEMCDEAISVIGSRRVFRGAGLLSFEFHKIGSLVQSERYQSAIELILKIRGNLIVGGVNWQVAMLYLALSYLHLKDYKKANDIALDINDAKRKSWQSHVREVLEVYLGYIAFAYSHIENKGQANYFYVGKMLNSVPTYSRDKRGLNISILIIQFLFLLKQHKYSQLIDREDALRQYCYRYLRRDDTFRSHCFIRMLLEIPRADFNRIRTERYAEPYLKKLRTMPLRVSEQSIEVEIIPYEDLWGMTLDLLV